MVPDVRLDQSPAGQILRLLQQQGAISIKEIETQLGVTTTAVRQQLTALAAADLVTSVTVREKRGRPHAMYTLSEKGHGLFASGSESLALVLLEEVLHLAEPDMLRQLLQRVGARLGQQFAAQMHGTEIVERLRELASWLDIHGITNKVDEQQDAFVLTEYACPYYGLARQHREVCEMEVEAMERALGSSVTLSQSQFDGHHGCQFQVKKDRQDTATPVM